VGGTADRNVHSFYKLLYYPHNIHFLFAAAHMEGQSALTLEASRKLVSKIPEEAYRQLPPLEDFRPMPLYALVRFGRWAEILEEPRPPEDLQFSTGIWHWARGMAYLRLGQLDKAEIEQIRLVAIAQTDAMKEQDLASFPKAATILEIAANILGGELAGAHGATDTQIAKLQAAVETQDDLPYIEPPAWFFPVRQTLGAALLQDGRATEAEAVYREDLRQYPDNGWSLFGLAESLRAQGKLAEAAQAQAQFEAAWQYADVVLTSSRF
jgi:tetratricopeptide (TPR) repeat protein